MNWDEVESQRERPVLRILNLATGSGMEAACDQGGLQIGAYQKCRIEAP